MFGSALIQCFFPSFQSEFAYHPNISAAELDLAELEVKQTAQTNYPPMFCVCSDFIIIRETQLASKNKQTKKWTKNAAKKQNILTDDFLLV